MGTTCLTMTKYTTEKIRNTIRKGGGGGGGRRDDAFHKNIIEN